MVDNVFQWIGAYGYLAIGALLAIGIFGIPIPDETIMAYSGVLAASGKLDLGGVLVAAVIGGWVGITVNYIIGVTAGDTFLRWLKRKSTKASAYIEKTNQWIVKAGKWVLLFAYWIPGVRHMASIVAGASDMRFTTFILVSFPGGVLWAVAFILVGYFVGNQWRRIADSYHFGGFAAVAVVVAIVLLVVIYRVIRARRRRMASGQ